MGSSAVPTASICPSGVMTSEPLDALSPYTMVPGSMLSVAPPLTRTRPLSR
jgi:hypothetical protein